ncbi:MAG: molecular chaperone DnaJ [Candidatus Nanoarchaeia archaeon]|jgi:molecular chaperone DnaJ|nr:molecular chaperone DnaJ [Candidatus Nanoarchaeia archaeon]|tara:strand:- start:52125 stop:53252 length:1128 start_codon:yes stop_codon:yes gene_type:complete
MTKRDYYEILGINKNASKDEIKKTYKKLALKYHPDRNKEKGAEEKFKEISEAYAVLSDDTKKQQYDTYGHAGFDQRYSQEDIFRGADFGSVFEDLFGESSNIFDMFFGGNFNRGRRQRRGNDLQYNLTIDFEEAAFGIDKEVTINKDIECSKCQGSGAEHGELEQCSTCQGSGMQKRTQRTPFGMFQTTTTCGNCNGEGEVSKKVCLNCNGNGVEKKSKKIKIKIPKGIDNGQFLRIRGEGQDIKNGSSGDLIVVVNVKAHKYFTRDENNIHLDFPISFSQAALGDEVKVPTLEKEVKMKIPSGTQSHTLFRLKGKGIEDVNGYGKGDEFVRVIVKTPSKTNKKQKELFDSLAKENKEKLKIEKGFLDKVKDVFG